MKVLNLGCGWLPVKLEGWLNADIVKWNQDVDLLFDIRKPFPLVDNLFDMVRLGKVIDKLFYEEIPGLLQECYRVLKPGGWIRIITHDFEWIAQQYINGVGLDEIPPSDTAGGDLMTRIYSKPVPPLAPELGVTLDPKTGVHHSTFDFKLLKKQLETNGFVNVQRFELSDCLAWHYHNKIQKWDTSDMEIGLLRVQAMKPSTS